MPYDSNSSRSFLGLADDVPNDIRADDRLAYEKYAERIRKGDKEHANKYMLSRDDFTRQAESALENEDVKNTSWWVPEEDGPVAGIAWITGAKGKRTKHAELRDKLLDQETEKRKNLYYESLKQQGSPQTAERGGVSPTITPPTHQESPQKTTGPVDPTLPQPTPSFTPPVTSTTSSAPIDVNDQMQSIYRSHLADTGSVPMYEKTAPTQNYQLGRPSAVDGEGFNAPEMQIKNDSDKGILA